MKKILDGEENTSGYQLNKNYQWKNSIQTFSKVIIK